MSKISPFRVTAKPICQPLENYVCIMYTYVLYFSLPKFDDASQVQCTVVPVFGEPLLLVKDVALKENANCKYFSLQYLNVLIFVSNN